MIDCVTKPVEFACSFVQQLSQTSLRLSCSASSTDSHTLALWSTFLPRLTGGDQAPTPAIKTTAASEAGSPNPNLRIQPPSAFGTPAGSSSSSQRSSILKVALDPLLSLVPRIGSAAKYRSSRSQRDGLIASPRSSAPPSPNLYGPPSPSPGFITSPFGPPGSGYGAGGGSLYGDSNTLSPQTPYNNNRFMTATPNSASFVNNSPPTMLRQPPPPGPKRSLTSPPTSAGLQHSASSQGLARVPSSSEGSPPSSTALASFPTTATLGTGDEEQPSAAAGGIARSVSPFGASGLVSRRKGA